MWDQRYSSDSYAYGTKPNDFLMEMSDKFPIGKVLCPGEGEGRNAVWLAEQGYQVTAVDASEVGLQKAQQLAEKRGVIITTVHADLADYTIEPQHWDVIVSVFCHLPPELRRKVHQMCVQGLRPGGLMLLEAYTPLQLEFNTGGPPVSEMMMDTHSLVSELTGLEFLHLQECVREIHEGEFHNGTGAVVQVLAKK
ncbi:MAG: SAM-dependent methyltransferase [Gammaproteobacteria bacterium]